MPTTDTSEEALESLIYAAMTGYREAPARGDGEVAEPAPEYGGGTGWHPGLAGDYNRDYAVDLEHLTAFLEATQPDTLEHLDLTADSPTRRNPESLTPERSPTPLRLRIAGSIDVGVKETGHENRRRRIESRPRTGRSPRTARDPGTG